MSSVDALLDTAFTNYNAGHFDKAEELAREVLMVEEAHGDALYLLGLIAYQANALEPASQILYQAVKLYPNVENYALALASVLHKQRHFDEALSFYEKYKDKPVVLSQMGYIYAQKGQEEWAKSSFLEALKKDEKTVEATLGLAALLKKQGNIKEAEEFLLRAESVHKTPDVLYHLSVLYREQGTPQKSLEFIKRAISTCSNGVYFNEYGLILEQMGDEQGAFDFYIKASEISPYYADAYYNQGNIYYKEGNLQLAEDAYKRALVQDRDFLDAHHNLAVLLQKQGRKAECLGHYQEAVIINPKHVPSIYNLALMIEEMGEYLEATGLYFNALVLGLKNPELDLHIASALAGLYQRGKEGQKQALNFAKGWVKNFPENVIAKHTLNSFSGKKGTDIKAYSKTLFDVFAATYDDTMQKLQSHALDKTVDILDKNLYKSVLDLGCGTGGFAEVFKGHYTSVIGVDLSEEMLKKAEDKKLYKKLMNQSVEEFWVSCPQKFDLIAAVEVLGYMDNPMLLFQGIGAHLKAKGQFVFTVETPEKECELSLTGRYLYTKERIERLLLKCGLTIRKCQEIDLRKEGSGMAKGLVILAGR